MGKMKILFTITLSLVLIVGLTVCGDNSSSDNGSVGGECKYKYIPGIAEIVSISQPDKGENNCLNDPVKITFKFSPNASNVPEQYLYPNWSDENQIFTISDGKNPPRQCVIDEGLTVGSQHECVRKEIVKGTCTPVIFHFPFVDEKKCIESCFNLSPIITCFKNSDCNKGHYCAKPKGFCNSSAICTLKPDMCILVYSPVCGCDGITYSNECEASANGVSLDYEGNC